MRSDAELVSAALNGRRAAFGELVRRYERLARAAARSVLRDEHAVEDAVQDAFLAAYRKLGHLRNGSAFGSWVVRISRREALRLGRGLARSATADLEAVGEQPGRDGRLDAASQQLLEEVMALPDHERVVLMMRYFEGASVREIAEAVGRPVGTVTKQISRACRRLQRRLKEWQR